NAATANGGQDTSLVANTITVSVTSVNDAPDGANKTVGVSPLVLEDGTYTFQTADFGFSDTHDSPANVLAGVRITTLPNAGTLTLSGTTFAAGEVIPQASIAGGQLRFTPASNASGPTYAQFQF